MWYGMYECSMSEECMAKPTEGESTPQYKKVIFYEHRPSEVWLLGYGLQRIKENAQCPP
jgi:hypothetical protein